MDPEHIQQTDIDTLQRLLVQKQSKLSQLEQQLIPYQQVLHASTQKLQTLKHYLEQQLGYNEGIENINCCAQTLTNQQHFTEQINQAIQQQLLIVSRHESAFKVEESKCINQRRACKQLERLIEQYQEGLNYQQKQHEQKYIDEIALQQHQSLTSSKYPKF